MADVSIGEKGVAMRGILIAVLMLLVMSCTTQRVIEVPVERVRVDSVYLTKLQRDTLVERDSVVIQIVGDTVYRTHVKYIYKTRLLRDTVLKQRTDTITKVVTVEKERRRTASDYAFGIGLGVIAVLALVGWAKGR